MLYFNYFHYIYLPFRNESSNETKIPITLYDSFSEKIKQILLLSILSFLHKLYQRTGALDRYVQNGFQL